MMRLKPKQPTTFSNNLLATIAMLIVLAIAFTFYVWSEKQIDHANEIRQKSFQLVEELRHSSDDLTNMARAYVVTGNPIFKKNYLDILSIRNGEKPRPENYNYVYWDLFNVSTKPPRPDSSQKISLLELMKATGFSEVELSKLAAAKSRSDRLTKLELTSMKMVEDLRDDDQSLRLKATRILFDHDYLEAKANIMLPINECIQLMDDRTRNLVSQAQSYANFFRFLFIFLSFSLFLVLLKSYKELIHTLGASLDKLSTDIEKIGKGDFTEDASIPPIRNDSVMGMILHMRSSLRSMDNANKVINQQLKEQELHLRLLLAAIPDLVWVKNTDGIYLSCNPMFERFFGAKESEIVGKTDYDFVDKDLADLFHMNDQRAIVEGKAVVNEEEVQFASDGRLAVLETIKTPIFGNDGKVLGVLGIARDISERKANEARVKRLSDLYNALSQCNEAIMRCKDVDELFPQICRDAVLLGNMKMAWIGFLDPTIHRIVPVASYGDGTEYLNGLEISIEPDSKLAQGPSGLAATRAEAVWCQDYMNDPMTQPWRHRGLKFGWHASAALPLFRENKVVGVLTLYSGEKNVFDEPQRNLLIEMALDISFALEKFNSEKQRRESESQLKLAAEVFRSSSEGFIITDSEYKMIMINNAFTEITGYSAEDAIGQNPSMLSSGTQDQDFYSNMWDKIDQEGFWRGEVWNRRKNGEVYPEWLSISVVKDSYGKVTNYIGIFTDITKQKSSEAKINRLAHFDDLTGLPNRVLLADYVNKAISKANRKKECFTLMFLDLDHFKNVNDSLGHQIGDKLLIKLGEILKSCLRNEDIVARFGGDEFILLLNETNSKTASLVAQKILNKISNPLNIDPYKLVTTASIGIAVFPNDGMDIDALFRSADTAMYKAKQSGRNNFCFFTQEMQLRSDRTLMLENALKNAIENKEMMVYYQPQVLASTGKVVGAEALIRWNHPQYGFVSPAEFIPIAESGGQILKIGKWVLSQALNDLKYWISKGLNDISVAVNISAVQFNQPDFIKMVSDTLSQSGLSSEYLELELTESVAMEDATLAIEIMNKLHEIGIKMSIDDFGTGYSSLSQLKKFNVFKLKIDQSFVRDLTFDNEDKAIVLGIINLAHSLGLKTIAEGVETKEQLEFLAENGCHEIQGYYFSKPIPNIEFIEYVTSVNSKF